MTQPLRVRDLPLTRRRLEAGVPDWWTRYTKGERRVAVAVGRRRKDLDLCTSKDLLTAAAQERAMAAYSRSDAEQHDQVAEVLEAAARDLQRRLAIVAEDAA